MRFLKPAVGAEVAGETVDVAIEVGEGDVRGEGVDFGSALFAGRYCVQFAKSSSSWESSDNMHCVPDRKGFFVMAENVGIFGFKAGGFSPGPWRARAFATTASSGPDDAVYISGEPDVV